jgi:hypothetical protein
MNLNNEFDELARRKLQEQAFPFEEANWSEMQKSLNGGRKRRAGGFWILGSATLLLVGISSWWLLQDRSSTGQVTDVREERSGNAPERTASEAPAHTVIARTGSVSSSEKAVATGTVTEAPVTGQAANATKAPVSNTKSTGSDVRSTSSNTSIEAVTSTAKGGDRPTASIAGAPGGSSVEKPEDGTSMGSTVTSTALVSGHVANKMTKGEDRTNDGQGSIASTAIPTGVAAGTVADESTAMNVSIVPEVVAQQTKEVGSENTTVGAEEQAAAVDPADSVAAEPTMAPVTLHTPADSAATALLPASLPPLIPERAPWEISLLGGVFSSNSTFTGGNSADWSNDVGRMSTGGAAVEVMHMGRHFGLGLGLHYGTYAERITLGELSSTTTTIDNFWFLVPVDTTLLFISDTINAGTDSSYYVGQSVPTTINVLAEGADTTSTTAVTREARELVNRTSYLEIPLLFDVHLVQGPWSLGLRAGPTVGFLTGRTGALPNAANDGYTEFGDQAFREVMVGYTARAYIRYRWNDAWSIGLEPALRGQLMNSLGEGAIDRRSSAFGGMISLSYRLR